MTEIPAPHFVRTVLVPMARPDTARHMLELATSLVDPQEGRVIALIVSISGENERTAEEIAQSTPIVDEFRAKGHKVDLLAQPANSITRGILDGTREYGAEILILGVHQSERRRVKLGTVVENIVKAATCDVLVYRLGDTPTFDRVIVPLDGSLASMSALNTAVMLAKAHDLPLVPMYIQRDYIYRTDREDHVREVLSELEADHIDKEIIPGYNPAEIILRDLDEDDLLVIGFSQKTDFELQIENDLTNVLLNRAPGPLLLASRMSYGNNWVATVQRHLQRFNPALTQPERNELVWMAQKSSLAGIDYIMGILLSALLASLGLLLNSVAVIIGAMLVAPLLQPLASLATGLVTGLFPITQRSTFALVQGAVLALGISVVTGLLLPVDGATSEMLARGNPTLLDAAVALVSGWIAAYATVRKEIPAALAGVAIAAALMPPLCTTGLALALGNIELALGSALLAATNILFIIVAEYSVFFWLGMRPGRRQPNVWMTRLWLSVIGVMLIIIAGLLVVLGRQALDGSNIASALSEQFPGTEMSDIVFDRSETGVLEVIYTARVARPIPPDQVATAEDNLSVELGEPVALEFVGLPLVRPQSSTRRALLDVLARAFPTARVVEYEVFVVDSVLQIEAVIRTTETITVEDVRLMETQLAEQLGESVDLSLVLQTVLEASTAGGDAPDLEPTSEPTPAPTPGT